MILKIVFCFLVSFVAFSQAELFLKEFELEDDFVDFYADKKNCTKPGPMCEDCKTRVFCFQLPDGEWIKDPLDDCPMGQTCMTSTAQCTADINIECLVNYKFTCFQRGLFPDAYNCSKYHLCLTHSNGTVISAPTNYECKTGFAYDPITTLCKKKAKSCSTNYPVCRTIGQTGPIGGHPSLYFICLTVEVNGTRELFPQIFYCQDDYLFIEGDCLSPSQLSGIGGDGKCEGSGDFYLEDGCEDYNECASPGSAPVKKRCDAGEVFDPATGSCKKFQCLV